MHRRSIVSEPVQGFTLIEVCIAMVLLIIAATGAATLSSLAIRGGHGARTQTSTLLLAVQKLEALRGLLWTVDANGQPRSDVTTDLSVEPPAIGGSGLLASPAGSLDDNLAGFVDFLDPAGQWVGTGSVPPATARFVRRWLVKRLPEDPDNTVILQVRVTTVSRYRAAKGGRADSDALLTTVYTRKAH